MDVDFNIIKTFESIADASRETGINKTSIANVCKGLQRRKTAGGFRWKFAEE